LPWLCMQRVCRPLRSIINQTLVTIIASILRRCYSECRVAALQTAVRLAQATDARNLPSEVILNCSSVPRFSGNGAYVANAEPNKAAAQSTTNYQPNASLCPPNMIFSSRFVCDRRILHLVTHVTQKYRMGPPRTDQPQFSPTI
jgi:hypothetical protein